MRPVRGCASVDGDLLDLVSDLDVSGHVHAVRDLTEIRVLLVEECRILLHDEELRVIVEGRILASCDTDGPKLEAKVVVFAGYTLAARTGAFRVAALNDPILNAMERQVVVEAASRFAREALDGLWSLVRAQRERERAAFRKLDGRLCGRLRS
jgi:hypothetical protein